MERACAGQWFLLLLVVACSSTHWISLGSATGSPIRHVSYDHQGAPRTVSVDFDATLTATTVSSAGAGNGSQAGGIPVSSVPPVTVLASVAARWQSLHNPSPGVEKALLIDSEAPDFLLSVTILRPRMAARKSPLYPSESVEYRAHDDLIDLLDGRTGLFLGFRNGSIPYFLPNIGKESAVPAEAVNALKGIAAALQFRLPTGFAQPKAEHNALNRTEGQSSNTVDAILQGPFGPFTPRLVAVSSGPEQRQLRISMMASHSDLREFRPGRMHNAFPRHANALPVQTSLEHEVVLHSFAGQGSGNASLPMVPVNVEHVTHLHVSHLSSGNLSSRFSQHTMRVELRARSDSIPRVASAATTPVEDELSVVAALHLIAAEYLAQDQAPGPVATCTDVVDALIANDTVAGELLESHEGGMWLHNKLQTQLSRVDAVTQNPSSTYAQRAEVAMGLDLLLRNHTNNCTTVAAVGLHLAIRLEESRSYGESTLKMLFHVLVAAADPPMLRMLSNLVSRTSTLRGGHMHELLTAIGTNPCRVICHREALDHMFDIVLNATTSHLRATGEISGRVTGASDSNLSLAVLGSAAATLLDTTVPPSPPIPVVVVDSSLRQPPTHRAGSEDYRLRWNNQRLSQDHFERRRGDVGALRLNIRRRALASLRRLQSHRSRSRASQVSAAKAMWSSSPPRRRMHWLRAAKHHYSSNPWLLTMYCHTTPEQDAGAEMAERQDYERDGPDPEAATGPRICSRAMTEFLHPAADRWDRESRAIQNAVLDALHGLGNMGDDWILSVGPDIWRFSASDPRVLSAYVRVLRRVVHVNATLELVRLACTAPITTQRRDAVTSLFENLNQTHAALELSLLAARAVDACLAAYNDTEAHTTLRQELQRILSQGEAAGGASVNDHQRGRAKSTSGEDENDDLRIVAEVFQAVQDCLQRAAHTAGAAGGQQGYADTMDDLPNSSYRNISSTSFHRRRLTLGDLLPTINVGISKQFDWSKVIGDPRLVAASMLVHMHDEIAFRLNPYFATSSVVLVNEGRVWATAFSHELTLFEAKANFVTEPLQLITPQPADVLEESVVDEDVQRSFAPGHYTLLMQITATFRDDLEDLIPGIAALVDALDDLWAQTDEDAKGALSVNLNTLDAIRHLNGVQTQVAEQFEFEHQVFFDSELAPFVQSTEFFVGPFWRAMRRLVKQSEEAAEAVQSANDSTAAYLSTSRSLQELITPKLFAGAGLTLQENSTAYFKVNSSTGCTYPFAPVSSVVQCDMAAKEFDLGIEVTARGQGDGADGNDQQSECWRTESGLLRFAAYPPSVGVTASENGASQVAAPHAVFLCARSHLAPWTATATWATARENAVDYRVDEGALDALNDFSTNAASLARMADDARARLDGLDNSLESFFDDCVPNAASKFENSDYNGAIDVLLDAECYPQAVGAATSAASANNALLMSLSSLAGAAVPTMTDAGVVGVFECQGIVVDNATSCDPVSTELEGVAAFDAALRVVEDVAEALKGIDGARRSIAPETLLLCNNVNNNSSASIALNQLSPVTSRVLAWRERLASMHAAIRFAEANDDADSGAWLKLYQHHVEPLAFELRHNRTMFNVTSEFDALVTSSSAALESLRQMASVDLDGAATQLEIALNNAMQFVETPAATQQRLADIGTTSFLTRLVRTAEQLRLDSSVMLDAWTRLHNLTTGVVSSIRESLVQNIPQNLPPGGASAGARDAAEYVLDMVESAAELGNRTLWGKNCTVEGVASLLGESQGRADALSQLLRELESQDQISHLSLVLSQHLLLARLAADSEVADANALGELAHIVQSFESRAKWFESPLDSAADEANGWLQEISKLTQTFPEQETIFGRFAAAASIARQIQVDGQDWANALSQFTNAVDNERWDAMEDAWHASNSNNLSGTMRSSLRAVKRVDLSIPAALAATDWFLDRVSLRLEELQHFASSASDADRFDMETELHALGAAFGVNGSVTSALTGLNSATGSDRLRALRSSFPATVLWNSSAWNDGSNDTADTMVHFSEFANALDDVALVGQGFGEAVHGDATESDMANAGALSVVTVFRSVLLKRVVPTLEAALSSIDANIVTAFATAQTLQTSVPSLHVHCEALTGASTLVDNVTEPRTTIQSVLAALQKVKAVIDRALAGEVNGGIIDDNRLWDAARQAWNREQCCVLAVALRANQSMCLARRRLAVLANAAQLNATKLRAFATTATELSAQVPSAVIGIEFGSSVAQAILLLRQISRVGVEQQSPEWQETADEIRALFTSLQATPTRAFANESKLFVDFAGAGIAALAGASDNVPSWPLFSRGDVARWARLGFLKPAYAQQGSSNGSNESATVLGDTMDFFYGDDAKGVTPDIASIARNLHETAENITASFFSPAVSTFQTWSAAIDITSTSTTFLHDVLHAVNASISNSTTTQPALLQGAAAAANFLDFSASVHDEVNISGQFYMGGANADLVWYQTTVPGLRLRHKTFVDTVDAVRAELYSILSRAKEAASAVAVTPTWCIRGQVDGGRDVCITNDPPAGVDNEAYLDGFQEQFPFFSILNQGIGSADVRGVRMPGLENFYVSRGLEMSLASSATGDHLLHAMSGEVGQGAEEFAPVLVVQDKNSGTIVNVMAINSDTRDLTCGDAMDVAAGLLYTWVLCSGNLLAVYPTAIAASAANGPNMLGTVVPAVILDAPDGAHALFANKDGKLYVLAGSVLCSLDEASLAAGTESSCVQVHIVGPNVKDFVMVNQLGTDYVAVSRCTLAADFQCRVEFHYRNSVTLVPEAYPRGTVARNVRLPMGIGALAFHEDSDDIWLATWSASLSTRSTLLGMHQRGIEDRCLALGLPPLKQNLAPKILENEVFVNFLGRYVVEPRCFLDAGDLCDVGSVFFDATALAKAFEPKAGGGRLWSWSGIFFTYEIPIPVLFFVVVLGMSAGGYATVDYAWQLDLWELTAQGTITPGGGIVVNAYVELRVIEIIRAGLMLTATILDTLLPVTGTLAVDPTGRPHFKADVKAIINPLRLQLRGYYEYRLCPVIIWCKACCCMGACVKFPCGLWFDWCGKTWFDVSEWAQPTVVKPLWTLHLNAPLPDTTGPEIEFTSAQQVGKGTVLVYTGGIIDRESQASSSEVCLVDAVTRSTAGAYCLGSVGNVRTYVLPVSARHLTDVQARTTVHNTGGLSTVVFSNVIAFDDEKPVLSFVDTTFGAPFFAQGVSFTPLPVPADYPRRLEFSYSTDIVLAFVVGDDGRNSTAAIVEYAMIPCSQSTQGSSSSFSNEYYDGKAFFEPISSCSDIAVQPGSLPDESFTRVVPQAEGTTYLVQMCPRGMVHGSAFVFALRVTNTVGLASHAVSPLVVLDYTPPTFDRPGFSEHVAGLTTSRMMHLASAPLDVPVSRWIDFADNFAVRIFDRSRTPPAQSLFHHVLGVQVPSFEVQWTEATDYESAMCCYLVEIRRLTRECDRNRTACELLDSSWTVAGDATSASFDLSAFLRAGDYVFAMVTAFTRGGRAAVVDSSVVCFDTVAPQCTSLYNTSVANTTFVGVRPDEISHYLSCVDESGIDVVRIGIGLSMWESEIMPMDLAWNVSATRYAQDFRTIQPGSHVASVPAYSVLEPGRTLYVTVELTDFSGNTAVFHSHCIMWNPWVPAADPSNIVNNLGMPFNVQYWTASAFLGIQFPNVFFETHSDRVTNIEYLVTSATDPAFNPMSRDGRVEGSTWDPLHAHAKEWVAVGTLYDKWQIEGVDLLSGRTYQTCLRAWSDTAYGNEGMLPTEVAAASGMYIARCAPAVLVDTVEPPALNATINSAIAPATIGDMLSLVWPAAPVDVDSGIDFVQLCAQLMGSDGGAAGIDTTAKSSSTACIEVSAAATGGLVPLPMPRGEVHGLSVRVCAETLDKAGLATVSCVPDLYTVDITPPASSVEWVPAEKGTFITQEGPQRLSVWYKAAEDISMISSASYCVGRYAGSCDVVASTTLPVPPGSTSINGSWDVSFRALHNERVRQCHRWPG
eukprot:INCI5909.4.p1 GENE.INCI5909.4~~INCI5909.4.p1  ORF type:complete len:3989 (-),score=611.24 INCI5909.4:11377-23343(-)